MSGHGPVITRQMTPEEREKYGLPRQTEEDKEKLKDIRNHRNWMWPMGKKKKKGR